MISQITILFLDIIFFVGKLSSRVPDVITRGALFALSGVGLISLPYFLDFIIKTKNNAVFAFQAGNYFVMTMALLRIAELTSNVGLVIVGFVASMVGFMGYGGLQTSLYLVMLPWGGATLVLSIILLLGYLYLDYSALKQLRKEEFNEKADAITATFDALQGREVVALPNPYLAAHIRACMDKDTFEQFLRQVHLLLPDDIQARRELISIVALNIETQLKINLGGQVTLNILGYILMGIQRYYTPNSLVSASINLTMALFHSIKLLFETLKEIHQRRQIAQVGAF